MKIEGIEKLTAKQKQLMFTVNEKHTANVGHEYKDSMRIIKAWRDKTGTLCVKLASGEWYHYLKNNTWY